MSKSLFISLGYLKLLFNGWLEIGLVTLMCSDAVHSFHPTLTILLAELGCSVLGLKFDTLKLFSPKQNGGMMLEWLS